jgi:hypothetical protein
MAHSSYPVTRITTAPAALADFLADYWDCFTTPATHGSAEQWARSSLQGAQSFGGLFSFVIWQLVLGFSLEPPETPGTVAGWRITEQSPGRCVLDSDGRLMRGRMVFEVADEEATWTTMIHYHHPLARPIWELAANAHRALVPQCLSSAQRTLSRANTTSYS